MSWGEHQYTEDKEKEKEEAKVFSHYSATFLVVDRPHALLITRLVQLRLFPLQVVDVDEPNCKGGEIRGSWAWI